MPLENLGARGGHSRGARPSGFWGSGTPAPSHEGPWLQASSGKCNVISSPHFLPLRCSAVPWKVAQDLLTPL